MHALSKSSTCLSFGLTQRITHPEHSFITAKFTNYHSQAIAALRSLEAQLHRGDNHYAQPPGGWDGKRHRAGKTENQVTQNLTHFFSWLCYLILTILGNRVPFLFIWSYVPLGVNEEEVVNIQLLCVDISLFTHVCAMPLCFQSSYENKWSCRPHIIYHFPFLIHYLSIG